MAVALAEIEAEALPQAVGLHEPLALREDSAEAVGDAEAGALGEGGAEGLAQAVTDGVPAKVAVAALLLLLRGEAEAEADSCGVRDAGALCEGEGDAEE